MFSKNFKFILFKNSYSSYIKLLSSLKNKYLNLNTCLKKAEFGLLLKQGGHDVVWFHLQGTEKFARIAKQWVTWMAEVELFAL